MLHAIVTRSMDACHLGLLSCLQSWLIALFGALKIQWQDKRVNATSFALPRECAGSFLANASDVTKA